MKNNVFLFAIWPGVSLVCLFVGIGVRYVLTRTQMAKVKDEMSRWWNALCGSMLWQLSMGLLIAGHMAALVLPHVLLRWNANPVRLYVLEGCAFVIGLAATISTAVVMWRHLGRAEESVLSEVFDTVFITMIFVGLLSGIGLAAIYRWGSSWAAITLTPYISSLLRAKPATDYVLEMPPLVRLHVFSAFAAIAVIPLTRLSYVLVYAVDAGLDLIGHGLRPLRALRSYADVLLHNLGSRLWPEED